jgi:hypothetical protein
MSRRIINIDYKDRYERLLQDWARLVSENTDLKFYYSLHQTLIADLVKNGAHVCDGYRTVNVALPDHEIPASQVR